MLTVDCKDRDPYLFAPAAIPKSETEPDLWYILSKELLT